MMYVLQKVVQKFCSSVGTMKTKYVPLIIP